LIPLGYLVLAKRYGFMTPTFKNQMASFGTMAIYQICVLAPISRLTMVNLNFALCHSHADPLYSFVKYYYFVVCCGFLNIFSYLARWTSLFVIRIVHFFLSFIGINYAQINLISEKSEENKKSSDSISTKD
jgi:hypothetical protein